jgi:hypothetical protein
MKSGSKTLAQIGEPKKWCTVISQGRDSVKPCETIQSKIFSKHTNLRQVAANKCQLSQN